MPKKDYPSREQRMKDLTRQLEQGIREVFDSGKYTEYLAAMSRFHRYSARNVLLIQMQLPNATRVASAKKWREEFGRNINRGEKAIYIIAPAPIVRKVERQKIDPDTKAPMLDENGHVIMEEKEFQVPLFRPVPVFDVSQTSGRPLPQLAEDLTGDVRQYEAFLEALRRTAPVPIEFIPMAANMDGYFSLDDQRIAIREGMSQVQTISAAVHEITHSILHNQKGVREDKAVQTAQELEAESVSYVVCQYFGIETGANSFGYFPEQIKEAEGFIAGLEKDMATLAAHPHPVTVKEAGDGKAAEVEKGFAGMVVRGDTLTDKDNAGAAILEACKEVKDNNPVEIGSYRGFAMFLSVENFGSDFILTLKGEMSHRATLGTDAKGNLTRIDNALAGMPDRVKSLQVRLGNLREQLKDAKAELGKPFPQEAELAEKSARLAELNVQLDIDSNHGTAQRGQTVAKAERPSVLEGLRRPVPPRTVEKKQRNREEVR